MLSKVVQTLGTHMDHHSVVCDYRCLQLYIRPRRTFPVIRAKVPNSPRSSGAKDGTHVRCASKMPRNLSLVHTCLARPVSRGVHTSTVCGAPSSRYHRRSDSNIFSFSLVAVRFAMLYCAGFLWFPRWHGHTHCPLWVPLRTNGRFREVYAVGIIDIVPLRCSTVGLRWGSYSLPDSGD
ncbi:hypothetical protein PYCCODRAFT_386019 [Trametes coccinea BRFM310]|uniref:Uncharacterized protein n=1 Tax=Trametes coccinea (strain BRFM310) TaxID=1353009 RepID=A0A1Y2J6K6_TRAC3|nr:hypothetical protein PYCCODRAFT_386019 [Trametes coccinea BRFM310]